MASLDNSIYIVIGELNMVVTALRRSTRWSSHVHQEEEQDNLLRNFQNLKECLNHLNNINDIEPLDYLSPFLDIIRSENTSGLVTSYGLSSVHKFLSYGLIDAKRPSAAVAAENIADAVTHARFLGTDAASDEVILLKIVQVLRLLLLIPLGTFLTNESICEIIQSFFRMCFEMRCSELLRRTAENALTDIVQLLFSCLPQFTEDLRSSYVHKLKMHSCGLDKGRYHRRKHPAHTGCDKISSTVGNADPEVLSSVNSPIVTNDLDANTHNSLTDHHDNVFLPNNKGDADGDSAVKDSAINSVSEGLVIPFCENQSSANIEISYVSGENSKEDATSVPKDIDNKCLAEDANAEDHKSCKENSMSEPVELANGNTQLSVGLSDDSPSLVRWNDNDYVNPRGIRFTPHSPPKEGAGPLIPYGLPCVRELFRLLVCLINPTDRHNSEMHIQIGLNMLTVALEAGVDNLGNFTSLLSFIKDDMCRNLFSLLSTERLTVFVSTLRIFVLVFEALRTHLKFQLETFFTKLMSIILSEMPKISYEQREMSLDCITQLWRIPGFVTELYINYDCDLYCSNLFEEVTKLLSKNAFPLSGLYSVHLLSLDALLAVIENIECHCHHRMLSGSKFCPEKEIYIESHSGENCLVSVQSRMVQPNTSGYLMGQNLRSNEQKDYKEHRSERHQLPLKPNRMKLSSNIPSHEELMAIKRRKKIIASGTEHFNNHPSKGILFLQEHGVLKEPLDPQEVATFLRDNPQLDKKMIGEYVSNRKNLKVLEAFVRSFPYENTRIDEALRQYLETFRLPGEAPLISLIMEHFAEHWHKSNKEPFANSDAAFTLAYAIIMLNVDQHNYNVKKQSIPMTLEEFKKNLKNVNGNKDFEEDLLEKIYTSIRNEEIVMPAEQTGLVKENYMWKVLLRRGNCKEGNFIHTPNGIFDHDLFSLVWGPTVAALSFIFDKSTDSSAIEKAVSGFYKCAMIAAHYEMCDVFDNLVISVCKFTTLVNSAENPKTLPISFGNNSKAQMATKAVFRMAHRHGDILREGWKNLLDSILHLFRAKLLPKDLVEAEDFVNPSGVISLIREDVPSVPRTESGIFSSFYSYITSESPSQRSLTMEDELAKQAAAECIKECHCEQLFTESKFLRIDSLQELVKTLIFVCHVPEVNTAQPTTFDEDSSVFVLEILIKIVLLNRDRVLSIWTGIQDHLCTLVINSASTESTYMLERAVVGILRIAIRLVRKEEMIPQVLHSLEVLLFIKTSSLIQVSRQVACALHELLRTNAANIHSHEHWSLIFSLLERVGAGVKVKQRASSIVPELQSVHDHTAQLSGAQSDSELSLGRHAQDVSVRSERGYTSDSELYESQTSSPSHYHSTPQHMPNASECVNKDGEVENYHGQVLLPNQYSIILHQEMLPHNSFAFLKCCESLAFLVRDAAHITVENFESCVHCIRTFVEASVNGGLLSPRKLTKSKSVKDKKSKSSQRKREEKTKMSRSMSHRSVEGYDADDEDKGEDLSPAYQQVSMQLLDLMHTLHTRAAAIFSTQTKECGNPEASAVSKNLWNNCWCPLLQGIARLCCDTRRTIRTSALTLLPRALLVPDLQTLSPTEWEACFNKVLFPLLSKLLENISPDDPIGMEETRMRGATLLCKVFLQHLAPLLTLPTFMALWLTVLDFMDKYIHVDGSGLLTEAIPESLKNMLLVMDTAGVFQKSEECNQMWHITWDRINSFLPDLKNELFKPPPVPFVTSVSPTKETVIEIPFEPAPVNECPSSFSNGAEEAKEVEGERVGRKEVDTEKCPLPATSFSTMPLQCEEPVQMSSSLSLILHPPSPSVVCTIAPTPTLLSSPIPSVCSSSTVPLLLNPSVVSEPHMPSAFSTQVLVTSDFLNVCDPVLKLSTKEG